MNRLPCAVYVHLSQLCFPFYNHLHPYSTMITGNPWRSASALYALFLLPLVSSHMEMSWPYPLRSKFNPANSYQIIDYSMTSPLSADGSNYPCKGYQKGGPVQPVISYSAGSAYNMSLAGTATHGGGSCQLSLSYDSGASFRVIKSMIGGCPLTTTYDFTIPLHAPAGTALLAWSWQNFEGNREFYMNCAEVSIISATRKRRRRQSSSSFNNLPYIWKANLASVTHCTTTEGESPVYPHPGPDVEYGGGMSSSNAPTPGDCDAPTSNSGQASGNANSSPSAQPSSYSAAESAAANSYAETHSSSAASTYGAVSSLSPTSSSSVLYAYAPFGNDKQRQAAASSSYSTTTLFVDCPETVTMTIYPPALSTATVTLRSISRNQATTYAHTTSRSIAQSHAQSFSRKPQTAKSTVHATYTATVVPVPSKAPSGSTGRHPPYAKNTHLYLPCVPGTFICTSKTTWDTCGTNHLYGSSRKVAAGMQCVTFLSHYSGSNSHHGQQGHTLRGYYRDDRIVRARPYGDCAHDGAIRCTSNGHKFMVCDLGGWVAMGSVRAGTICKNGHIT